MVNEELMINTMIYKKFTNKTNYTNIYKAYKATTSCLLLKEALFRYSVIVN